MTPTEMWIVVGSEAALLAGVALAGRAAMGLAPSRARWFFVAGALTLALAAALGALRYSGLGGEPVLGAHRLASLEAGVAGFFAIAAGLVLAHAPRLERGWSLAALIAVVAGLAALFADPARDILYLAAALAVLCANLFAAWRGARRAGPGGAAAAASAAALLALISALPAFRLSESTRIVAFHLALAIWIAVQALALTPPRAASPT